MKKCPYCAKEIRDEAIKCEYCGGLLEKAKRKWYFKTSTLIVSFLSIGPLALPLLWFNPYYSKKIKIIISAIVIILSYYLGILFVNALKTLKSYYQGILNF